VGKIAFQKLSKNFPKTFQKLSKNFPKTFQKLSEKLWSFWLEM
jgi:hypothetical protein